MASAGALAAALQSAVDAQHFGMHPGAPIDQAKRLAKALRSAASAERPLFRPPGHYEVSEVALPPNGAHHRRSAISARRARRFGAF
jgi:hypothetical protein